MLLRPATAQDAPLLARMHRDARVAAMPWLPVLHTKEEDLAWMTKVVLAKQQVVVAVRDETAIGFMAQSEGWIEHLYVAPSAWRNGAGSTLIQLAKRHQPNGFRLWTFQRNTLARDFYRKRGFAELRFTDGNQNEEREPDVLLGWTLAS
jgi:GNAT superfamily N-acetyltransferase